MKIAVTLFLALAVAHINALAQCTKDTDCKGERICERGVCTAPGTSPSVVLPIKTLPKEKPLDKSLSVAAWLKETQPPSFEAYRIPMYGGRIIGPEGIRQVRAGEWRNKYGKLVEPLEINFADKYYVAANSCGTGCRYYTITDLSKGKDLDILSPFTAADPPPTTSEGYTYTTELLFRPESRLLVAQYHVNTPSGEQCRERAFVIEVGKLKAITETRNRCNTYALPN